MLHLIRKEYGYTDEYILEKTFSWLRNSVEVISYGNYQNDLQLSQLVQLHIAQVMGAENVKIPEWGSDNHIPEIEDSDLSGWGIGGI